MDTPLDVRKAESSSDAVNRNGNVESSECDKNLETLVGSARECPEMEFYGGNQISQSPDDFVNDDAELESSQ